MPGYVIHLAVAKKYAESHDINNIEEFYNGCIEPDLQDKTNTHYFGEDGNPDLYKFLDENSMSSDFDKGFFLHLLTDYIFYKEYLQGYDGSLYNEYNKTNKPLIERYSIKIPEKVQNELDFIDEEPEILDIESISMFIDEVAKFDLKDLSSLKDFIDEFNIINENVNKKEGKTPITKKDIAIADQKSNIRNGERFSIRALFDKIKNIFKSKEQR